MAARSGKVVDKTCTRLQRELKSKKEKKTDSSGPGKMRSAKGARDCSESSTTCVNQLIIKQLITENRRN